MPPHSPVSEAGPQAVTGPLIGRAGSLGSGAYCERAGVWAGSWALWWTGVGPGLSMGSGSLGGRPVGSHPISNKLERGFHNGVCQRQHARGGTGFPQWPSPASRVMVSTSCLLPPQERL